MKVYNVRLCYQCDDFMFQMHYWAIFFPFVERLVIAALRGKSLLTNHQRLHVTSSAHPSYSSHRDI